MRLKAEVPSSDECCCVQCFSVSVILDITGRYSPECVGWCERHWQERCRELDEDYVERQQSAVADDPVQLDHVRQLLGA